MTMQSQAQCICISAMLFLGKSGRDGCGTVAEGGPEQNLALHVVLLASGKEWIRERGALRSDSGLQGRGSLEKDLLSGYSGSSSPRSQM